MAGINYNAKMRGAIIAVLAAVVVSLFIFNQIPVSGNTVYFSLSPGTPFLQDWTNTGLIPADHNWTNVPSIMGYRGDDFGTGTSTTVAGTDPQVQLLDMSATPVNVEANEISPNGNATGGVGEFQIDNPTIALQGSGTADAPHIDIRLNTTACVSPNAVGVAYDLRDIDGSSDDAVQPVALHYRIGSTGNYTNLPFAFVSDASTGPSQAVQVTSVITALPNTTRGQAQVHVRLLTTNAAGSDEWIGIDNINVTCAPPTAAQGSLSGRVITADGAGIRNAVITIAGGNLPQPKMALTGAFGYYSFEDLTVGETYVLTINSKRYTFTPPTRLVTLSDSLDGVDFQAIP